jgi:hypothetical protein
MNGAVIELNNGQGTLHCNGIQKNTTKKPASIDGTDIQKTNNTNTAGIPGYLH